MTAYRSWFIFCLVFSFCRLSFVRKLLYAILEFLSLSFLCCQFPCQVLDWLVQYRNTRLIVVRLTFKSIQSIQCTPHALLIINFNNAKSYEQENMSPPSADMTRGRPSTCERLIFRRQQQIRPNNGSSQSVPNQPAPDPPPVSKYGASFLWFWTSADLDLWPFHLKFATPLTRPLRNVYANCDFSTFFCFRVTSPCGTDGQTDRWTDGQMDRQDE